MDTLVMLSDSIIYNTTDQMYVVDCDIIILENDTLKILPGEIVKFLSYSGGPPIRFEIIVYGNLIAIGEKDKTIILGDPDANFSEGHKWKGIKYINTSQNGESVLKYCDIISATSTQVFLEKAIYCENSSPIIDHCVIQYLGSSEFEGGAFAIGLVGQSYPIITFCTFQNIFNGVAVWCNPYNIQDTVNYPSPLLVGCNFMASVQGFHWPQASFDKIILYGGFLDNCYFGVGSVFCDTTLGNPIDTLGDGICNTTSTYELKPRFLLVDGVVNPRSAPLITGINEDETEILPTASKYLVLNNNYPNPFSQYTTIKFEVKNSNTLVSLFIYDSKGNCIKKLIENSKYSEGTHNVNWNVKDENGGFVQQGIYFYKLISNGEMLVKKAIVIK